MACEEGDQAFAADQLGSDPTERFRGHFKGRSGNNCAQPENISRRCDLQIHRFSCAGTAGQFDLTAAQHVNTVTGIIFAEEDGARGQFPEDSDRVVVSKGKWGQIAEWVGRTVQTIHASGADRHWSSPSHGLNSRAVAGNEVVG